MSCEVVFIPIRTGVTLIIFGFVNIGRVAGKTVTVLQPRLLLRTLAFAGSSIGDGSVDAVATSSRGVELTGTDAGGC